MLQRVVRSTVIDAPIERVWAVIRDFNSHDQWHDVVAHSRIEAGERSDQVGCVRNFHLQDGNHIREQLLTLDDKLFKSTYCIVDATVPLQRYVATVTLKPVTDGNRTFWHWESSFATPPGREKELRDMVSTKPASRTCAGTCAPVATCSAMAPPPCPPPCRCPRARCAWRATAGPRCCRPPTPCARHRARASCASANAPSA
jgi:uncharacterized protein YndB with AHSA1/START domain